MKRAAAAVIILLTAGLVYFRPIDTYELVRHVYVRLRGFHSEKVRVGGHRIFTTTGGKGPPLLLVHGLGSRGEDYAPILPRLARSHRLYVPDLLGFGLSDRPDVDYSIGTEAAMLREYLDVMNVERCDVMAASMGGWVALKFAADHPERVRSLVLIDSAGFPFATAMTESTWTPANLAELDALIALQSDRFTLPRFIARDLLRLNREHAWIMRRAMRSMLAGRDLMNGRVQRVTMPVLLMWGARDRIVPVAIAEQMKRELPDAKLVVIEGCGHLAIIECRNQMLPHIESFLASATATTRSAGEGRRAAP